MNSPLEESFITWLGRNPDLPPCSSQYKFHPDRNWRFDFAWLVESVAVEIEGLTHDGGRHQRIAGFIQDAQKYEAAMMLGWTVYRVPGPWVCKKVKGEYRHIWREEVMENLKALLRRRQT